MNQNAVNTFDAEDIAKNKTISALSYLGILFFLPLVVCPDSKFGRFHANQSLVLLICMVICNVVGNILVMILGFIGTLVLSVLGLAQLALVIYGIVNTIQGNAKPLPVIGNLFTILK